MSERRDATRRMRRATGLSLLLHAVVLLLLGRAGLDPDSSGAPRPLQLQITGVPEEAPAPDPVEAQATDVPRELAQREPSGDATGAAAAEPAPERPAEATVAEAPPAPAPDPVAATPVVASAADTGRAVPAAAVAAPPETEPLAVSDAERERLLRRVSDWVQALQASDPRRAQLSWQQDGRPYTAVLTPRPAPGATGLDAWDVEITTEEAGRRWQTGLSLRRVAFSNYTQFVDRWDPDVQLHDDEIAGRFHVNSSIVIGYDRRTAPRFLGKVTTAGRGFRVADAAGRRRRDDIFQGGIETGVERIALPAELRPAAPSGEDGTVHRFERDARIRFLPDGSFEWSALRGGGAPERVRPPDEPLYLVAAQGAELHVSGTLRGQVLVYAPERIVIEDDLRYARDPRARRDSPDLLGLVSDGLVLIAPPWVTGRGDLEVQAAIYARRRFVVTEIDSRRAGTLRIYGSLTAGSLTATEPRYATRIEYDPRFEDRRPPGFPVLPRYELATARAEWTPAELAPPP